MSPVKVLHRLFLDQVRKFEDGLDNNEEIGVYLASSADGRCLRVEKIGYRDPYFIILEGLINDDQKAKLIQHVTQISVLFIPLRVSSSENRQPRRFGFEIPDENP
ncbi:DUF6173 family protein [Nodosilinea sp. LEGE 07088]|uniref:DUF6173 family protein n=1 Tax=Nodosilinea sp. LEGE 07088 TaxID=2777968 RepID=UPI001D13C67D